jgi:hypothetical protein
LREIPGVNNGDTVKPVETQPISGTTSTNNNPTN